MGYLCVRLGQCKNDIGFGTKVVSRSKFVFGDGERGKDLKWLTSLMLFVVCAM